jgi:acetylornithine deacetylase
VNPELSQRVRSGDATAIAAALVRTPSVNPVLEAGGAGEEEIARLTGGWLEEWGFDVDVTEVSEGRWNTVASRSGNASGLTLMLNGHLDTVGVEGMTVDPFAGAIEGGRLWGRGACDMKGGVASLLSAAASLSRDRDWPGRLIVALTADEEHASLGMQALASSVADVDAAIVCEPTDLSVMPAHKGFVWVELDFTGRAAHGSRPDVGVDAIEHAGMVLSRFGALRERLGAAPPHPLLGHGSFHAGTIQGGSAASVYPAACRLVIERRTLPGETADDVMSEVEQLVAGVRSEVPELDVSVKRGLSRPATEVAADAPLVVGLLEACREHGLEGRVEPMTAWVDAAFLNEAGVPAVCFGPGSIGQAHSADEWIEVAQIERCARVLEAFARTFFA